MTFHYKQVPIKLQGVQPNTTDYHLLSLEQLGSLIRVEAVEQMLELCLATTTDACSEVPIVIHQVLEEFADVFSAPKELPPKRAHDHSIQLIQGARPFRLRPYRYTPAQKG